MNMDNMKFFVKKKKKKELDNLMLTLTIYIQDVKMVFDIEKCARLNMRSWKKTYNGRNHHHRLYHPSLPVGLQSYILYRHTAVVYRFLPLLAYVMGSIGVFRSWVRPYFSRNAPHVWFV